MNMGKYTRLFSLPARHRGGSFGPSSYRRAPAAAIVRGTLYAARQSQPTNPGREVAPPMRQLIPRCVYKIVVVTAHKNLLAVTRNPGSVYERTGTEPGDAEV